MQTQLFVNMFVFVFVYIPEFVNTSRCQPANKRSEVFNRVFLHVALPPVAPRSKLSRSGAETVSLTGDWLCCKIP